MNLQKETKSVGSDIHEGSYINYINMKRYSGLHDKLCTIENIEVADDNARKNKNKKYSINKHDKNRQYEYVFYHTYTLIRKSIKYKIIRLVNSYLNREIDKKEFKVRMCAYYGWLKHADAKNLLYKIQSITGVRYSNWNGKRTNIAKYYDKYVRVIQVIN